MEPYGLAYRIDQVNLRKAQYLLGLTGFAAKNTFRQPCPYCVVQLGLQARGWLGWAQDEVTLKKGLSLAGDVEWQMTNKQLLARKASTQAFPGVELHEYDDTISQADVLEK